jgi:hypothetical protein
MSKKIQKKFNYAVGRYWEGESGSVGCYNYFGEVHYGTMEDAKHTLAYVQSQKKTKAEKEQYKIFQLVEIPE